MEKGRKAFVKRLAADSNNVRTIKLFYRALVRLHFEYVTEIWAPQQASYKLLIERVQRKFLRLPVCKLGYRMSVTDQDCKYNIM